MLLLGWMMILHFVADFIFQSREMGQKKSSEFRWLFKHLTIQWLFFALGLIYFVGPVTAVGFATLNAVIHGIIDWNIWNLYKVYTIHRLKDIDPLEDDRFIMPFGQFKYWEDHMFYITIGFDQLLHCLTIIGLFALLV